MAETAKRVQAILMPNVQKEIDARTESYRGDRLGYSESVNTCLDRYFHLLNNARREMKDRFSREEVSLMADACNGTAFDTWSLGMLAAGVADAIHLDGLDEKWKVDGNLLLTKLRDLSLTQTATVVDSIERFWRRVSNGEDVEPGGLLD